MKQLGLFILFIAFNVGAYSQSYSNIRTKTLFVSDSIQIDTLSIVPSSLIISANNNVLNDSLYQVDYMKSIIYFSHAANNYPEQVSINYRVFPVLFNGIYPQYPSVLLNNNDSTQTNTGFTYKKYTSLPDNENTLLANGNISRGVSVGNGQNMVVNSNLNLQLSGKISENINIEAYLSDKNVPVQPDGYSQQIQEFDKIYIRLYDSTTYLQMGDVAIKGSNSHFLKFSRSIMGGDFGHQQKTKSKFINNTQVSGAIAKGNFNRIEFTGIEAVQGPYPLTGANNETYIVILAGSENIYINGVQLERGENADYVIDYNTAELTFTPKHLITKDTRIIAEFEYSDKNYNRFLLYAQNQVAFKKGNVAVQFFSESDAKNQPVNIDLTAEHEQILANAGDNPLNAIVPNYDSITYDPNRVLYKMVDSTVNGIIYDSILVQSYNPDSAFYTAGFALVGNGIGNYIADITPANGKVYQWVAPINNIAQGNYEPVQLLVAPVKHQLMVGNIFYNFTDKTNANIEVALSNKDLNTFSNIDNNNNKGTALKLNLTHLADLGKRKLILDANYETLSQDFKGVDRFKSAEFNRDWNLYNPLSVQEHLIEAEAGLKYKHKTNIAFKTQYLNRTSQYEGFRNELNSDLTFYGFTFMAKANLLNSADTAINTLFYRHYISLLKPLGLLNIKLAHDFENNQQNNQRNDSLAIRSEKFSSIKTSIFLPDTLKRNLNISYQYRTDFLPLNNSFEKASTTQDVSLNSQLAKSRINQLKATVTWRELKINQENLLPNLKSENNFMGRIDHKLRFNKNWLSFFTFYEMGTGMETHKEYSYIEVAVGQGIYVWVDYNENNIPELNEFEISAFPEEANYIRIYTPTNDYIKVYSLKLNETIKLDPAKVWRSKKGIKQLVSRFSNTANLRLSQKHTNTDVLARINPFETQLADSQLINQSFSYRNVLSFNRINPIFGVDWVYQNRNQKSLISNGFEQNLSNTNELKIRWNISQQILVLNSTGHETKTYESEFFSNKNYKIEALNNGITCQWQPSNTFRVAIKYNYKQKDNLWGDEKSKIHTAGPELKYSWLKKGSINLSAKIVNVDYSETGTSAIAYEMMEGHQNGENYQWSANISRKLNKYLQLTVNYSGRKPSNSNIIHTGQFSLSALF